MRCVLHSGLAKTGTSSIQSFMRLNREELGKHGFYIPNSRKRGGRLDELYLLGLERYEPSRILAQNKVFSAEDLEERKAEYRDIFRGWMKEQSGNHTAIFSHEGFARLTVDGLPRVRDILLEYFDEITVVVCLRRQDLLINSLYKNQVRNRGKTGVVFENFLNDYNSMMEKLEGIFGAKSLSPFVFPDSALEKTDLFEAFFAAARLDFTGIDIDMNIPRANVAWDVRGVEILREVNELLPSLSDGRIPAERTLIEKAITRTFTENVVGYTMPREQAEMVLEINDRYNRAVAKKWFGRDQLFNDDMSRYDRVMPEVSNADFTRVLLQLAKTARPRL